MQTRQVLTLAVVLAQLGTTTAIRAETKGTPLATVSEQEVASACPTPEAVAESIRVLLNQSQVPSDGSLAPVEVRDLGDNYIVTVNGQTRAYTDEARDCSARARAAAVFAALVLPPAALEPPPDPPKPQPPPPPPPVPPPPPAKPKTSGLGVGLEIGALGAVAPRSAGSQVVLAGELHFVVATPAWGVGVGGSLPRESTLHLSSGDVLERRIPIDVTLRRSWVAGWLRTGLEVGAIAAIHSLQRGDAAGIRVVPEFRVAATFAAPVHEFGFYVRIFSDICPITPTVIVAPDSAQTSSLWVGVAAGLVAKFL